VRRMGRNALIAHPPDDAHSGWMKFGLSMFPTHYAMRPDELARAAEEHGFESLFVPEHTHIPASRRTPWPGGGELPCVLGRQGWGHRVRQDDRP
jgi:alkanesulfonate monooxygenase SsuD/methylene tetrahydromethanopterin reductase-like flavin-dependent oxidoreductase (luciferase family)